ncbi:MAG TPA: DinB family protein [Bellilinea sp.]|nr:DinB family protein [Bellilinea sp.]
MQLNVGLENGADGRPLAWALDFPGCFVYGSDGSEAVINMAPTFVAFKSWVASHTRASWLTDIHDVDVRLTEVWEVYNIDADYNVTSDGDYEVNAWFRHDWKPLTRLDVRRGQQILKFARAELVEVVQTLPAEILDRTYAQERWSIRGVLGHIAKAEWWYMDRLEQAGSPRSSLPQDTFEQLAAVRTQLEKILPYLEGVELVRGVQGEIWSPRKLLRRAIWHELDHLEHVKKLLAM